MRGGGLLRVSQQPTIEGRTTHFLNLCLSSQVYTLTLLSGSSQGARPPVRAAVHRHGQRHLRGHEGRRVEMWRHLLGQTADVHQCHRQRAVPGGSRLAGQPHAGAEQAVLPRHRQDAVGVVQEQRHDQR